MTALVRYPPGPRGLPVVGEFWHFQRDPLTFLADVQRRFGDMVSIPLFGRRVTLLARPEFVRYVLVDAGRKFTVGERPVLREFLGEALLTTDGEVHRRQRAAVQPAFHRQRVEAYASWMTQYTEELLTKWRVGERRLLAVDMQELTLRVVTRSLFNIDLADYGTDLSRAFTGIIEGRNVTVFPSPFRRWRWRQEQAVRMHAARIEGFVHDLIAERRAEGRDHGDVLSLLLFAQDEEGERFSDRALRDQTLTFLAAGHETTANALGWTFALLSAHRAVRERLLEELHPKLADRIPLVQDLPALRYLDAVVRESLRLYPPAWIISRTVMQAVHLGDYDFPVGSVVLVSPWLMHRDPRFWEAPLAFRPERWLDSPEPPAASGMYFPFGAGARMCIGMPFAQLELRLVLAMILRRFFPEVEAGWDDRPIARVTLRPRQGLPVLIRSVSTQIRETGGMTTVSL